MPVQSTIMDKSLCTLALLRTRQRPIQLHLPSLAPPWSSIQCFKPVLSVSPDFQRCIGWGGGWQRDFKRIAALFSNFSCKTQITRWTRTFVHDCRSLTQHNANLFLFLRVQLRKIMIPWMVKLLSVLFWTLLKEMTCTLPSPPRIKLEHQDTRLMPSELYTRVTQCVNIPCHWTRWSWTLQYK